MAKFDIYDNEGNNVLHLMIIEHCIENTKLLLDYCDKETLKNILTKKNLKNETPFDLACHLRYDFGFIKLLLNYGSKLTSSILYLLEYSIIFDSLSLRYKIENDDLYAVSNQGDKIVVDFNISIINNLTEHIIKHSDDVNSLLRIALIKKNNNLISKLLEIDDIVINADYLFLVSSAKSLINLLNRGCDINHVKDGQHVLESILTKFNDDDLVEVDSLLCLKINTELIPDISMIIDNRDSLKILDLDIMKYCKISDKYKKLIEFRRKPDISNYNFILKHDLRLIDQHQDYYIKLETLELLFNNECNRDNARMFIDNYIFDLESEKLLFTTNYKKFIPKELSLKDINDKCYICFITDTNIVSKCNHYFCISCISKWLKIKEVCPYCYQQLQY